jgi:hypothetical protein
VAELSGRRLRHQELQIPAASCRAEAPCRTLDGKRNAAGKIVNGVLLLQGNTGNANWPASRRRAVWAQPAADAEGIS